MCESPTTTTEQLVAKIAQRNFQVHTAQDAIQYLTTLATVQVASKAQMPNYTTMVQHFLGTLQLPMTIYMLDYYLPMLSPKLQRDRLHHKVPAQFESPGRPSSLRTCLKAANSGIGRLLEVMMLLPFATQAWRNRHRPAHCKCRSS